MPRRMTPQHKKDTRARTVSLLATQVAQTHSQVPLDPEHFTHNQSQRRDSDAAARGPKRPCTVPTRMDGRTQDSEAGIAHPTPHPVALGRTRWVRSGAGMPRRDPQTKETIQSNRSMRSELAVRTHLGSSQKWQEAPGQSWPSTAQRGNPVGTQQRAVTGESRPSPRPPASQPVTHEREVCSGPSGQQTLLVYKLREISQKVEEPDHPWPGLSSYSRGHGALDVG